MSRCRKRKIKINVDARSNDDYAFSSLGNTKIRRVEKSISDAVSGLCEISDYPFECTAAIEVQQAFDVLRKKKSRALVSNHAQKLPIQDIPRIASMSLGVRNGKTLAREASDDNVAVWNVCALLRRDVTADDMITDVASVRLNCVGINVIRPDDFMTRLDKPKIKAAGTAE